MGEQTVSNEGVERGLMKAVVLSMYGSADGLELKEVEKPEPGADEVLVKVHASSINDWDAGMVSGTPYFMRIFTGLFRPKVRIMGCDVAGTVELVGAQVHRFRPGDAVYGDIHGAGFGAYAEYVCVKQDALEKKEGWLSRSGDTRPCRTVCVPVSVRA